MTAHRLIGDSHRDFTLLEDDRSVSPQDGAECDLDIRASDLEDGPPKERVWRSYLGRLLGWWPDE